jgi:uncharacterized RDD family membrane protein YckC
MKTYNAHETIVMKRLHGQALASFGRRAAAFVIDVGVGAALMGIIATILEPFLTARGWVTDEKPITIAFFANWYSTLGYVLFFTLASYFGKGRPPGKRLLRIRIVSTAHDSLTLWQCLERSLGYGFSILEFGFGFVQFFIHPNRRTVHDRVAETVVVLDDRKRKKSRKSDPIKSSV